MGSRVTDEEAARVRGEGVDVLPLTAYPVRQLPQHVVDVAKEAVIHSQNTPSRGLLELREAISKNILKLTGVMVDPASEVLVTYGAMHALNVVMQSILDPGDEVVLYTPSYFFDGIIRMAGGHPVHVPLQKADGYRFNIELLERRLTGRTKAILINSPVNPTGYVASQRDLTVIAELAGKYGRVIISDESYDRLVYDGERHTSFLEVPGAKERTILVKSFTKSYALPSWRVGYVVADRLLTESFVKTLEWNNLYCSFVAQKVAAAAMSGPQEWLAGVAEEFQYNRDMFLRVIEGTESISVVPPKGGPFLFIDISQLPLSCEEVSQSLLERFGLVSTPGSCHFSSNHIRLPFGGTRETIMKAVDRLEEAFNFLEGRCSK
ncbi:MAG: pyridoxal phosphate-dependent aminotransferase [Firmicutes bacterium]|nr:pyridoxal phosphate-dependent aminotransferase [Bacillota bacterium]